MDQLERLGARVSFHDDHVEEIPALREWPQFVGRRSVPLDAATLHGADVALIVTDHDRVDYAAVLEHSRLVVDSRGVYRQPSSRVVKA
jgi:UDP-N-acetyl-D-glucosamine dehydrogenase